MKEPPDAKARIASPQPDTADAPDQILTGSQATKRLGVPLSTIRSLVRDGILRATSISNGAVGLRESEIQRYLDRSKRTTQSDLAGPQSIEELLRVLTERSSRSRIRKTLNIATV